LLHRRQRLRQLMPQRLHRRMLRQRTCAARRAQRITRLVGGCGVCAFGMSAAPL
jgi:hypothetical protein